MQENANNSTIVSSSPFQRSKSFADFLQSFQKSEISDISLSSINKFGLSLDDYEICMPDLTTSLYIVQSFKEFDRKTKIEHEIFPESPKMCKPWKLAEEGGFDTVLRKLDEIIRRFQEKVNATEKIIQNVQLGQ